MGVHGDGLQQRLSSICLLGHTYMSIHPSFSCFKALFVALFVVGDTAEIFVSLAKAMVTQTLHWRAVDQGDLDRLSQRSPTKVVLHNGMDQSDDRAFGCVWAAIMETANAHPGCIGCEIHSLVCKARTNVVEQ